MAYLQAMEYRSFRAMAVLADLLTLVALWLDLSAWAGLEVGNSQPWRFARTLVCGLAVWSVIRQSVDVKSRWLIPFAMTLAVLADHFLILRSDLLTGIVLFAVMQVVLMVRHLSGAELARLANQRMALAGLIGVCVLTIGNAMLLPSLLQRGLALPVLVYSALLVCSVLAAYSTRFGGQLPIQNAKWAFWAMVLFLFCDITVGIGAAFEHTVEGQLVRACTGLLYTPSLLLLVRSGMK